MLSANTVLEVGFAEYQGQFLWALKWSVGKLDDKLDQRANEVDSEGFAAVADAVAAFADRLEASPDQLLSVLRSKLEDTIGADANSTALTKNAVRDLIADLVDQAHDDALLNAVQQGRSVLANLATDEIASAVDAIAVLEELLRFATDVAKPMAMRRGSRLANRWFREYESGTADTSLTSGVSELAEAPAAMLESSVEAGIKPGPVAGEQPLDQMELRLVAEFPASFCLPIGKPLAYGNVGIVEQSTGKRVAVFRGETRTTGDFPNGGILDFPVNVRAKMGGRIDLLGNYYIVVGGGKSVARALLSELGLDR